MTICRLRAISAGTTACSDSFSSQPPCCALRAYTVQPHSCSCSLAAGCAISTNSTTTTTDDDDDDAAAVAAAFESSQPHRTRNQLQQQQPHSSYLAPLLNSSLSPVLHRRLLWAECKGEPVVTKCRHYFCEPCALRLGTDAPCAARCGASCLPTSLARYISHTPSPSPPAPLSVWMRSQPQHQDWQVCSV